MYLFKNLQNFLKVIKKIRGKLILENDGTTQGTSPAYISDFNFGKVDKGGAEYQSVIEVSAEFTDTYCRETELGDGVC